MDLTDQIKLYFRDEWTWMVNSFEDQFVHCFTVFCVSLHASLCRIFTYLRPTSVHWPHYQSSQHRPTLDRCTFTTLKSHQFSVLTVVHGQQWIAVSVHRPELDSYLSCGNQYCRHQWRHCMTGKRLRVLPDSLHCSFSNVKTQLRGKVSFLKVPRLT